MSRHVLNQIQCNHCAILKLGYTNCSLNYLTTEMEAVFLLPACIQLNVKSAANTCAATFTVRHLKMGFVAFWRVNLHVKKQRQSREFIDSVHM